jgi:hypothetical protein
MPRAGSGWFLTSDKENPRWGYQRDGQDGLTVERSHLRRYVFLRLSSASGPREPFAGCNSRAWIAWCHRRRGHARIPCAPPAVGRRPAGRDLHPHLPAVLPAARRPRRAGAGKGRDPADGRPGAPPHGPGPAGLEAVPQLPTRPRPGHRPRHRDPALATQPRLLVPQQRAGAAHDPRAGTGDRLARLRRLRAVAAARLLHRDPGRHAAPQPLRPGSDGPGAVRGVRASVHHRPGAAVHLLLQARLGPRSGLRAVVP